MSPVVTANGGATGDLQAILQANKAAFFFRLVCVI